MQIKPIKTEYKIEYPSANDVKDVDKMLNNRKPKRWKRNSFFIGITIGLITISQYQDNSLFISKIFASGKPSKDVPRMMGKVAVPSSHLSEEETKEIINNSSTCKVLTANFTDNTFGNDISFINSMQYDSLIKQHSIKLDKRNKLIIYFYENDVQLKLVMVFFKINAKIYCLPEFSIHEANEKSNRSCIHIVFKRFDINESKSNDLNLNINSTIKEFIDEYKSKDK